MDDDVPEEEAADVVDAELAVVAAVVALTLVLDDELAVVDDRLLSILSE